MKIVDKHALRAAMIEMWENMPVSEDDENEKQFCLSRRRGAKAAAELAVFLTSELDRSNIEPPTIMDAAAALVANCMFNFFQNIEMSPVALDEIRSKAGDKLDGQSDQQISTHRAMHTFLDTLDRGFHLILNDHYGDANDESLHHSRQTIEIPRKDIGDA